MWNGGVDPIYILVPFIFTPAYYPNLTDSNIRKQVLIDWAAFVQQYSSHPAILGFLIGNELNTQYEDELDWLFSLVNQMIVVQNSIESTPHPITVPLADIGFKEIVQKYNDYIDIDFWSVQVYSHDLSGLFGDYTSVMASTSIKRPLLFTEFGADFLQKPGDPTQAEILLNQWNQISTFPYSFGGCIMEWSDEWLVFFIF